MVLHETISHENDIHVRDIKAYSPAICVALLILIEVVFLYPNLDIIIGPIIAVLFVYLYIQKKDEILVATFITIANDALGTVLFGRVSFQYVLIGLVIYDIIKNPKIRKKSFFLFIASIVLLIQPLFTTVLSLKEAAFPVVYILALLIQHEKYGREEFVERFGYSYILIMGAIAIHTIITGGVVFSEVENNIYRQVYQRRGILGVGIGDPNFSSLLLNIGVVFTLNCKSLNKIVRVLCFLLFAAAMAVTLSTSGLLVFVLVILLSVIINANLLKGIRRVLIITLCLVALFQLYICLPAEFHVPDIDAYIERMELKYNAFILGNMAKLTTKRSFIAEMYRNYIFKDQSTLGLYLGGNSLFTLGVVPHNTYLGYVLQFGVIGAGVIFVYMANRFLKTWFDKKDTVRKTILIQKILFLVMIASLSIYNGNTFVLLFLFLFLL